MELNSLSCSCSACFNRSSNSQLFLLLPASFVYRVKQYMEGLSLVSKVLLARNVHDMIFMTLPVQSTFKINFKILYDQKQVRCSCLLALNNKLQLASFLNFSQQVPFSQSPGVRSDRQGVSFKDWHDRRACNHPPLRGTQHNHHACERTRFAGPHRWRRSRQC